MNVGVGIRVGNVLECRPSIHEVFGGGIEDRLWLGVGGRFGTIVGSRGGGNLLGSTVVLVDGINDGLMLGTVTLGSLTGLDES